MKIEMTKKQKQLFDRLQSENGGRLILLCAYKHGRDETIHVAYWSHDQEGRLIIGENWHQSVNL